MSTALYRRYRPQTFADVIGQEHVTEPLMQALRTGRTGHAYLFSGPRGCGKTTSARILARCLNCEQGPTPTPCGSCPSCIALSAGGPGSVDVIEIDAASHGGVDDARDLRERAAYGPAQSRYKVYIIDEAHMVTPQGFNALLKIVEEPPAHVKFVFATTEPEKVIGTIRSRTHHYPFRLVPPARLTTYLEQLCALEKVPVEPGVLSFVVRAGGGSVRDSLSVLDQLIAGSADSGLTYAGAAALLGFTEVELLDAVVEAFAAQDGGAVFRQIDKVVETGQDPRRFVEDLLERFRDLIIVAASTEGADAVLRGLPEDQMHRLRQQAVSFGAAELSRCADLVNTGLTQMNGVTSPRLQLELICARLLLPAVSGAEGHGARLDRLERRLDAAGPLPSAPVGDIPTSGGSAVPAPGGDIPAEERPLPPAVSGARGREALRRARAAVREADGTATAAGNDRPAPESVAPEPAVREEAPPARPRPEAPRPEPTRPEAHRPEPAGPPTGASPAADRAPGTDRPDVDALRRSWPDVLAAILPLRKATWFLLAEHAQVMEADGERVVLGFANPGLVRAFHQGGHADVVGQAVHQTLGLRARVEGTTLPPSGPDGHPGHGGGGPGPRNGPGTGDPGGPDPAAPR
ncbi:DNA polymerase III subunit gamma and tau, partial [Austwickia chelonae]